MQKILLKTIFATSITCLTICGYNTYKMFQKPQNNLENYKASLATNKNNNNKPSILFLGDSIFQGAIGASWMSRIKHSNKQIINAGNNGDTSWNIKQRLDVILSLKLDTVILMVGTNDAMGSFRDGYSGGDLYVMLGNPIKPTIELHQTNLKFILNALKENGIKNRAVLTIPPLGEVFDSKANLHVTQINQNIIQLAKETDTKLLDFNAAIWKAIEKQGGAHKDTKEFTGIGYREQTVGCLLHNVFGWNWNDIGEYNNHLLMLIDNCHLSNRGGDVLYDLVNTYINR